MTAAPVLTPEEELELATAMTADELAALEASDDIETVCGTCAEHELGPSKFDGFCNHCNLVKKIREKCHAWHRKELSKMEVEKRLVVGSAPYVKKWWEANRGEVVEAGYKPCSINNAWMVTREDTWRWYFSTDYFALSGATAPNALELAASHEWKGGMKSACTKSPFWYDQSPGSGTMFLNVMYDIINEWSGSKMFRLEIAIIGNDLVPGIEGAFYSGSTPDYLRFGKPWLESRLSDLKSLSVSLSRRGMLTIVNLSEEADTMLPFPRAKL